MKINSFRIPVAAFVLGSATFAVGMFSLLLVFILL